MAPAEVDENIIIRTTGTVFEIGFETTSTGTPTTTNTAAATTTNNRTIAAAADCSLSFGDEKQRLVVGVDATRTNTDKTNSSSSNDRDVGGDGGDDQDHDDDPLGTTGTSTNNNNNPEATVAALAIASNAKYTLYNFIYTSFLFGALHGSGLACLSLATARFGKIGAWQSGLLYLSYTFCAVSGAAVYITKRLGSRNSIILGMICFCLYVACFWLGTILHNHDDDDNGHDGGGDQSSSEPDSTTTTTTTTTQDIAEMTGALIGGFGAGFLWTGQGVYFGQAAELYAMESGQNVEIANAWFAGIFAFLLLIEETILEILSTLLIRVYGISWRIIFALYAIVAVLATMGTTRIHKYDDNNNGLTDTNQLPRNNNSLGSSSSSSSSSRGSGDNNEASLSVLCKKSTTVFQLLINDHKMKYMIPFCAAFGFAGAFLNSFVNGEVVPVALNDMQSSWVGLFVSVHGIAAALASLIFGKVSARTGRKGPILIIGAVCFALVALPFLIQPDLTQWNWWKLLLVYSVEGVGRATYEGTLKAVFADYFSYEKEGAFSNIVLQNGLSSSIAYYLSFQMTCSAPSHKYCIEYSDGSYHNLLAYGLLVVITSIASIFGFWRASYLFVLGRRGNEELDQYRVQHAADHQQKQKSNPTQQQHQQHLKSPVETSFAGTSSHSGLPTYESIEMAMSSYEEETVVNCSRVRRKIIPEIT